MLLTLALCALGIGLLYVYLVWNYKYWSNRGVPGLSPIPVAGSFPWAFLQRQNIVYEIDEVYRTYRGKSPFVGIFSSRKPAVMLLDPKYIKTALTTNFKHFHDNDFPIPVDKESDPLLARNPFILKGEEWKEKRSEITPAFTNTKLKTMYPIMQHVCNRLTSYIHEQLSRKPDGFEAKALAAKFTTDVVANCIYGIDSGALSDTPSAMSEMGANIFNVSTKFTIYTVLVQLMPWIRNFYRVPFIDQRIQDFFEKLTGDAVKMRLESGVQRDDSLNFLLQIRQRKPVSDIEMAAHTLTFFVDGYETSSAVISNVLLQLAKNEKVQTRLRAEIEAAVQKSTDSVVSFEQILEFEYLEQVVNETLRHSPVIAFLARSCTESIELTNYEDQKTTLEKGTLVLVPVHSIQRDGEFYPNPEVFDPDRFSEENGGLKKYKDEGWFLTFGDGPRICLGMRFGLLQVKAAVVEIVRNFELTVNGKTQSPVVFEATNLLLVPKGGNWVDFRPLKKNN